MTAGITTGSWWAYRVSGWGGYWFWDPVENLALLPWLTTTALLHMLVSAKYRPVSGVWVIVLSISGFCLALFAIFMVRSGLLDSVHNFSTYTVIGRSFLLISGTVIIAAFVLFAYAWPKMPRVPVHKQEVVIPHLNIHLVSIILICMVIILLVSCLYPISLKLLTGKTVILQDKFYHGIFVPLGLLLVGLLSMQNRLPWKLILVTVFSTLILTYIVISNWFNSYSVFIILALASSIAIIIENMALSVINLATLSAIFSSV